MRPCAWPARAGGCRVARNRSGRPAGAPTTPAAAPLTPVVEDHRRTGLVASVAAGVLVLDVVTKQWAVASLADGPVGLVGSVRLALTHNTAGAFGLGGAVVPFLAVAALGLVLVMATTGTAATRAPVALALGLLLGGAFGNLLDRLFRSPGMLRGAVVDFVDLRVWPVFNLADAAITCGCLLLLWAGWGRP